MAGRKSTEEYKKEDYADAHLTELGWTQVSHHHQHEHGHQHSALCSMLILHSLLSVLTNGRYLHVPHDA